MTAAYWENILPSITTGRVYQQNMMVTRTAQQQGEDPTAVPICQDSGIYINRKQIFCVVMLQDSVPEDMVVRKQTESGPH
jgi:hypothetical protein